MRSGTACGSNSGLGPRLAPALLMVALAGCGAHHKSPGKPVPVKQKPEAAILVRLTADSHHPRVGRPWHYEVRVTNAAGTPVPAVVHLQMLFGGVPVGQIGRHRVANGVWQETIGARGNAPFPARARGVRLVFQAVVTALGQTRKANYWIRVR
jgi:hypothetical protein